jgi:hypothetical protein
LPSHGKLAANVLTRNFDANLLRVCRDVAIHGKFFDVILTQPFDARLTQKLPGI